MNKENDTNRDLPIETRIQKAERKIKGFFKTLTSDQKKFIENPVHQLAVLIVTLERLADEINSSDVLDLFEQGKQQMLRENPAIKSYNTTIKSYTAVWKMLSDMLPTKASGGGTQDGEDLLKFAFGQRPAPKK